MLKIIGMILLILLALILGLVLSVLFVPLRYSLEGEWQEEKSANASVTWFLHLLSVRGSFRPETGLLIKAKVLCFCVWKDSFFAPEKEEAESPVNEEIVHVLEADERQFEEQRREEENGQGTEETDGTERKEDAPEEDVSETVTEEIPSEPEENFSDGFSGEAFADDGAEPPKKNPLAFVKRIREKITGVIEKLRFSFQNIYGKLTDSRDWIKNEKNRASVRLLWTQAKKLLKHLAPTKGNADITFGFDDPYTTGQVLEAVSLIYPFCHKHLHIHPVFDEKIIEGKGRLKGRVRLGYVLWLAFGVFRDKHTRKLIGRFLG